MKRDVFFASELAYAKLNHARAFYWCAKASRDFGSPSRLTMLYRRWMREAALEAVACARKEGAK